jgi:hypothetical protein
MVRFADDGITWREQLGGTKRSGSATLSLVLVNMTRSVSGWLRRVAQGHACMINTPALADVAEQEPTSLLEPVSSEVCVGLVNISRCCFYNRALELNVGAKTGFELEIEPGQYKVPRSPHGLSWTNCSPITTDHRRAG